MLLSIINRRLALESNVNLTRKLANEITLIKKSSTEKIEHNESTLELLKLIEKTNSSNGNTEIACLASKAIESAMIENNFEIEQIETILYKLDTQKYNIYLKNCNDNKWSTYFTTTPNLNISDKLSDFLGKLRPQLSTNIIELKKIQNTLKINNLLKDLINNYELPYYDKFFINTLIDRNEYIISSCEAKNEDEIETQFSIKELTVLNEVYRYITTQREDNKIDSRAWSILLWHSNKYPTKISESLGTSKTEEELLKLNNNSENKTIQEILKNKLFDNWPSWKALEGDFISLSELLVGKTEKWEELLNHLEHIKSQSIKDDSSWNPATYLIELCNHLKNNPEEYKKYRDKIILRLSEWKDSLLRRDIAETYDWIQLSKKANGDFNKWIDNNIVSITPQNQEVIFEISKEIYKEIPKLITLLNSIGEKEIGNKVNSLDISKDNVLIKTLIDNSLYFVGISDELKKLHLYAIDSIDQLEEEPELESTNETFENTAALITDIEKDYLNAITEDAKDMYLVLQDSITKIFSQNICNEDFVRSIHSLKSLSLSLNDLEPASFFSKIELWGTRLNETGKKLSTLELNVLTVVFTTTMIILNNWKEARRNITLDTLEVENSLEEVALKNNQSYISSFDSNKLFPNEGMIDNEVDEIDLNILDSFKEEAQDIFNKLDQNLQGNIQDNIESINSLLHTLKGGSRISGLMKLGAWAHQIEDLTTKNLSKINSKTLVDTLQYAFDKARNIFNVATSNTISLNGEKKDIVLKVNLKEMETISESLLVSESSQKKVKTTLENIKNILENSKEPNKRLKRLTGEIYIEAESLLNSGKSKKRNNKLFDELEFDRFTYFHELTRKLEEAVSDNILYNELIESGITQISDFTNLSRAWLNSAQKDLVKKLYSEARIYEPRLQATVRTSCSELKKSSEIAFNGSSIWVDKKILDEVAPSLEHLVRNCIAHSIEMPEDRVLKGKPKKATIEVSVTSSADKFIFKVKDDGNGIDFNKIKERAKSRGLIQSENPTEKELCDVLFHSGFSTASSITNTAGRGVGLDAVKEMVGKIGGNISIHLEGVNPTFTIEIPMSSWLLSGIRIVSNNKPYVIDGNQIKSISTIHTDKVKESLSDRFIVDGEEKYPCIYLDYINGTYEVQQLNRFHPVVYLNNGRSIIGDQIEFIEKQPIKPLPNNLFRDEGISGTTILSDSTVGIVIDALSEKWDHLFDITVENENKEHNVNENLIMVVDDSLTIRKISEKFLRKHGYDYVSAENGLEAIKYLENNTLPAFILMDIEMPVMDGFEAIKRIKQMEYTKNIPVIFISSRAVDKHINYAKSIGALDFLGKPFNEERLLDLLKSHIKIEA